MEYVILVHGLARTSRSMATLERTLTKAGYRVIKVDYASTKHPVESLANSTLPEAIANCVDASKIHFVTHSMGGILLRYYLKHHSITNLGRTVMLAPPNHGSEIVDKIGSTCIFKLVNGQAGQQLGTAADSLPNSLGPINFEAGIIAATRNYNPILSMMMPSPHDGKVSVESSKVAGMSDHLSLAVTHTFMMSNKVVNSHTAHFLKHGFFASMTN